MRELEQTYSEQFGSDGKATFFAPGRVNLIGEHTDYNGGHVFPCALSVGTYAVARKREDDVVRFYSMNFPEQGVIESSISSLAYVEQHDWANYPKGVIAMFQQAGYNIPSGLDVAFYGNIPNGAGLSSSASIELVMSVVLKDLFELSIDMVEMVQLSQRAENEFVGVNCGIMDQFAIGMGKRDHALLLNCDTLEYKETPIKLAHQSLIIANTNKRRGLADSKYNERRNQCEEALIALQKKLSIASLGDLTEKEFEENKQLIQDPLALKRARHAVYENRRTMKAVNYLNEGDIEAFGRLMNESHVSLRDDYEVTGQELDAMVEAAWEEGAIGSRMTGAGFGGCTISIVDNEKVDRFIKNVGEIYRNQTNLEASFYVVEIGNGARKLGC
ncbi:galactokinase [Pseudalkalibacillus hwajinpoensis]|uniref:Galactokinase n=1 Tax=Guptibacillus hwajinpoensis TaxID=208199 RepID=A0A4U1MN47_9BACL|nr:galactokinase [Pseudalkalibacillus hwajinpoensis]TKD72417.1 galactokinase [Pseudalkalibacillus hwajinpoensis]